MLQAGVAAEQRDVRLLKHVRRQLFEALSNREAVKRLERENFQDEKVQRPLHEVGRFAHGRSSRLPSLTYGSSPR